MNQRDRDLAISRGLGKGLVSTGIMGSVGFAVLAAVSTTHTSAPAPTAPVRGNGGTHLRGTAATREGGGDDQGGDDGPARPVRPHRQRSSAVVPAPSVRPGSGGVPQATTAGS